MVVVSGVSPGWKTASSPQGPPTNQPIAYWSPSVRPGAQDCVRPPGQQGLYAVGGDDAGAVRAEAVCQVHRQVAAEVGCGRDQVAGGEGGRRAGWARSRPGTPNQNRWPSARTSLPRGPCGGAVGHAERSEDPLLHVVAVAHARGAFDDQAGQHVVGVGVVPGLPGGAGELGVLEFGDRRQRGAVGGRGQQGTAGQVVEPAGLLQQVAHGDVVDPGVGERESGT